MIKKLFSFLFICFIPSFIFSQLAITEVYHNTPYNESLYKVSLINGVKVYDPTQPSLRHHRGEYIEIYNYSDRDINLKGWYISDLQGTFWFPEKIIKSGQLILIAYSTNFYSTPFTELFPNTKDKADQIIFQDKILLRNRRDAISLGNTSYGFPIISDQMNWNFREEPYYNHVALSYNDPQNFYNAASFQLSSTYIQGQEINPNNFQLISPATPLTAIYKPPFSKYDDLIRPYLFPNYSLLNWSDNVLRLTNNICPINIPKEEQTPSGSFTSGNKCFSYDIAGNYVDAVDCGTSSTSGTSNTGNTYDELEAIKQSIVIAPNPTSSNLTIYWSGPALNKIYNLQVYSSGGSLVYGFNPFSSGVNSVSFSLQNQLSGTFIANFTLNTGQVVSKNILKW